MNDTSLPALLLASAQRYPNHPAIEDDSGARKYSELAEQAARIASALAREGGPDRRVGVLMGKSCDTVAALYGIMWGGAAYIPLDAGSPMNRLAAMINDSRMSALITVNAQLSRLVDALVDSTVRTVVVFDSIATALRDQIQARGILVVSREEVNNSPLLQPISQPADSLAYIIYTSGSTGTPKGVMISHGQSLAFVKWAAEVTGLRANDRLSSHAPFHFDLSIFDLYSSCLVGGTTCIVPDGLGGFPVRLAEWIEKSRISVWYSVPSILVQLWDRGRIDRFTFEKLRCICFAGEVFATKYLRQWMERFPRISWFNWYGPTETNVCTSHHPTGLPAEHESIPIGGPASGATIYLLDESGNSIKEPNREGEIWVDGPTVAHGYWNDPQKTRDRFISLPQVSGHSRSLYRTGDLACWNGHGELVFKGRRDAMIKSRGYRIELGEIEAATLTHAAIQDACAVPVPDEQIGHRIRLYVVKKLSESLSESDVERYLLDRVPRYMIPQELVFLEAMPRTSTGKIDRKSLEMEAVR